MLEIYGNAKKCIHVSILDFIHYPDDEVCYRKIHFRDEETGKTFSDKMEFQILELRKLPREAQNESGVMAWMRFLSRKKKEEFEQMARTNEYFDEAYNELLELSADDQKRLEYEARDKAFRDYNSQMESAEKRGEERVKQVFKLHQAGKSEKEIAQICGLTVERVREILE